MADKPDRYKRGMGVPSKEIAVCEDCGVVVYDEAKHDEFHDRIVAMHGRVNRWLGPPDAVVPHA